MFQLEVIEVSIHLLLCLCSFCLVCKYVKSSGHRVWIVIFYSMTIFFVWIRYLCLRKEKDVHYFLYSKVRNILYDKTTFARSVTLCNSNSLQVECLNIRTDKQTDHTKCSITEVWLQNLKTWQNCDAKY